MELALNELKVQAKKLCKELKAATHVNAKMDRQLKRMSLTSINELKLKHCQSIVAQQLGFKNWHHAHLVLSGEQAASEHSDLGTLFNNTACQAFVNLWFSSYLEAKEALNANIKTRYLLPYKKQFVVVEKEYLFALNLKETHLQLLAKIGNDMHQSYGSQSWDEITCHVIKNRSNK